MQFDRRRIIEHIRSEALSLPGVTQTKSSGQTGFQVSGRPFLLAAHRKDALEASFKLDEDQLDEVRKLPYATVHAGARRNWVTVRVESASVLPLLLSLLRRSYLICRPVRSYATADQWWAAKSGAAVPGATPRKRALVEKSERTPPEKTPPRPKPEPRKLPGKEPPPGTTPEDQEKRLPGDPDAPEIKETRRSGRAKHGTKARYRARVRREKVAGRKSPRGARPVSRNAR